MVRGAKARWLTLKFDVMTRSSAMFRNAKVLLSLVTRKCDGHKLRESAMVRRAKLRWSHVMRKCDSMPR